MMQCIAVGLEPSAQDRLLAALRHAEPLLEPVPVAAVDDWNGPLAGGPVLIVFDPVAAPLAVAPPDAWLVAYGRPVRDAAVLAHLLRGGVHAFVTRDVDDTPAGFVHRLRHAGILDARGARGASGPPRRVRLPRVAAR